MAEKVTEKEIVTQIKENMDVTKNGTVATPSQNENDNEQSVKSKVSTTAAGHHFDGEIDTSDSLSEHQSSPLSSPWESPDDDSYRRDPGDHLFPLPEDPNVITRHVHLKLKKDFRNDSPSWTAEMREEFEEVAPTLLYAISATTGKISAHLICKHATRNGDHIWVRFWFLRVMFGPIACSRQPWFADLAKRHPWVLDEADKGTVPENWASVLTSEKKNWKPKKLGKEMPSIDGDVRTKRKAAEPLTPSHPPKNTKPSSSQNQGNPRNPPRTRSEIILLSSDDEQQSENLLPRANNEPVERPTTIQGDFELEIETLKQRVAQLESAHDIQEAKNKRLKRKLSYERRIIHSYQSECHDLRDQAANSRDEYQSSKNEYQLLKSEYQSLKNEYQSLKKETERRDKESARTRKILEEAVKNW